MRALVTAARAKEAAVKVAKNAGVRVFGVTVKPRPVRGDTLFIGAGRAGERPAQPGRPESACPPTENSGRTERPRPGRVGPYSFLATGWRKDRSTLSFGSVETGPSRHSHRIISGRMAPLNFCPCPFMPQE